MPRAPAPRVVRMGGTTIPAGRAETVRIRLGGTPSDRQQVPARVVVGQEKGPRVAIVAATGGFEETAALAAFALLEALDPAAVRGSVIVVPVWRPGGRLAPGLRPVRPWRQPGDAGGDKRARNGFTLFSEVVVGSSLVLVLGSPPPGRRSVLIVRGRLSDPRVRRAALASGGLAAIDDEGAPGSLLAAAGAAGVPSLWLQAGSASGQDSVGAQTLRRATWRILAAVGALDGKATGIVAPATVEPLDPVRAPAAGLIWEPVAAGHLVRKGAVLARIIGVGDAKPAPVPAPATGVVLEAPGRAFARKGAVLFTIGRLAKGVRLASWPVAAASAAARAPGKQRVGWAEQVALPDLGVARLKAKIDTGARTSALHVAGLRTVDAAGSLQRRPIIEFTIPGGHGRGAANATVRAVVHEYVVVRDSSGHSERRPVIETSLRLGTATRRIRITLTDRGDMLFPMLIGRTALRSDFVIDPSRRYLSSVELEP